MNDSYLQKKLSFEMLGSKLLEKISTDKPSNFISNFKNV